MGIVFACIAPHGAEIIPHLAGYKSETFGETRRGMEAIAEILSGQKVDTIVIASPHNLRLRGNIGVITTEFADGTLKTQSGSVQIRLKCHRLLAQEILHEVEKAKLPVVAANYGTAEGESSCMPMDWGTLIPLWFFAPHVRKPRVVIVTPSREIPLKKLVTFGKAIAKAAEKSKARVAFVASADQAHTHSKKGPYGFHPDAKTFDALVVDAVKKDNLNMLLSVDQELVENAKPDSIWQMAVLIGVLKQSRLKGKLVSYQAPTYFGMLCAAYTPK